MEDGRTTVIAVFPPSQRKGLYKFAAKSGVVIVREGKKVIKVCHSVNLYSVAMRLYQKGGALVERDSRRATFEVVQSTYERALVARCLRHFLDPIANKRKSSLRFVRDGHNEAIIEAYILQSRYDFGEHKTDTTDENHIT
ncbi:MAG: hypothetical protein ACRBFS_08005 [Aureispira sp.]